MNKTFWVLNALQFLAIITSGTHRQSNKKSLPDQGINQITSKRTSQMPSMPKTNQQPANVPLTNTLRVRVGNAIPRSCS